MTEIVALPLQIGTRTVGSVKRRLVRVSTSLNQARRNEPPTLPVLPAGADGYLIASLPEAMLPTLLREQPKLSPFVRQRYARWYASLKLPFEDYLDTFSAKSRSTLKRKVRKVAKLAGGTLEARLYCSPADVEEFYRHARTVSSKSYQEKLLNAGLPEGGEFLAAMREIAGRDEMRGWVLFLHQAPISYLYAFADGQTLIYAYLGYDPAHAALSAGTVLQYEAMRYLTEEQRFEFFDFTEGDGQHKRLFATGSVDCLDILLLRPTLANLVAGNLVRSFNAMVKLAKRVVSASGLERAARTFISRRASTRN